MKAAQLPPVLPQTWIPSGTDPRSWPDWATPTKKRCWPPRLLESRRPAAFRSSALPAVWPSLGLLRQGLTTNFRRASMRGCIGLDCGTLEMRSATGIVPALTPTAALLVLIGIGGLTLMARRSARFKKLSDSGLISAAAGLALLFLGPDGLAFFSPRAG